MLNKKKNIYIIVNKSESFNRFLYLTYIHIIILYLKCGINYLFKLQ